jgi:hypothetical protein
MIQKLVSHLSHDTLDDRCVGWDVDERSGCEVKADLWTVPSVFAPVTTISGVTRTVTITSDERHSRDEPRRRGERHGPFYTCTDLPMNLLVYAAQRSRESSRWSFALSRRVHSRSSA